MQVTRFMTVISLIGYNENIRPMVPITCAIEQTTNVILAI